MRAGTVRRSYGPATSGRIGQMSHTRTTNALRSTPEPRALLRQVLGRWAIRSASPGSGFPRRPGRTRGDHREALRPVRLVAGGDRADDVHVPARRCGCGNQLLIGRASAAPGGVFHPATRVALPGGWGGEQPARDGGPCGGEPSGGGCRRCPWATRWSPDGVVQSGSGRHRIIVGPLRWVMPWRWRPACARRRPNRTCRRFRPA